MGKTNLFREKIAQKNLTETGRKIFFRKKNSRRADQLISGPSINKEIICIIELPAKTGLKNIPFDLQKNPKIETFIADNSPKKR